MKYTNLILQIVIIDLLYLAGAYTSSTIIQLVATVIFLLCVLSDSLEKSLFLVVALSVNQAMIVLTNNGISLINMGYLMIFLKIVVSIVKNHEKIRISRKILMVWFGAALVGLIHLLLNGIYYDLTLMIGLLIVVYIFCYAFKNMQKEKIILIYDAFILGVIMLTFNTLVSMMILGYGGERITAVLDNANYIAVTYGIAAICGLVCYCFKIETKKNIFLFFLCTLMLLATGSRGAAIAITLASLWVIIFGFAKLRKARLALIIIFVGVILFYGLLLGKVGFVVDIYTNLIGRTLEKLGSGTAGTFMDVSSGRFTLWSYYLNQLDSNKRILLIGSGSNQYFLKENGGYGLMAHNVWIGALMGFGLVGTFFIFMIYITFFSFIHKCTKICQKTHKILFSIPLTILVGYFFLDGIIDLRITLYIVLICVIKLLINENDKCVLPEKEN